MRVVRSGLVCLLALGLSACLTPAVPIPPPEPEKLAFALDAASGTATFSADPEPSYAGAVVYVFNRDRGVGVISTAEADGSVERTAPFTAQDGDQVVITFDLGDQLAATCVVLHEGHSSSAFECAL